MSTRKFFINDVSTAVRDNLEGLVAINRHLKLHKSFNIVFKSYIHKEEVALISGGGSGHEPSHAGFVGEGLLTASVSGSIFASPTAEEVLTAIKHVCWKDSGTGVLLIVPNYTGDRLNFGLAKERANLEGYNVDIFMFGDDCSFGSKNTRLGSRGLAGIFFIHKIAGALASNGSDLKTIKEYLESISERIASISISLGPCNVPGVGPSFVMPPEHLEIGLGIHGERGSDRIPYISAQEAINLLIKRLIMSDNDLSKHFSHDGETRIALLINDNGGLTTMEMNIIIKEAMAELVTRRFIIERIYAGRFVTSFDMVGVCISMIVVNDRILELLDKRCHSVITEQMSTTKSKYLLNPSHQIVENRKEHLTSSIDYNTIDRMTSIESKFLRCVSDACKAIINNESYLNHLDSESGDSDCGSTLATGARKILSTIESGQLKASFLQLANIIETCMGGTSGALFSLFFTALSSAVTPLVQSSQNLYLSMQIWASLLKHSCDTMTSYSHAKPGDRSLVDPLVCLIETLDKFPVTTTESLAFLVGEVRKAAEATALMTAKIGRASYSAKPLNQGPDPGAWAIFLIVQAILTAPILSPNEK